FREAMADYDSGNYDRAIESFKAAHRLTRAPELLFNIAQAYRRKGPAGCKDALDFFESYERQRGGKSRGIDVQPMIADMRRCTPPREERADRVEAPTESVTEPTGPPPAEAPKRAAPTAQEATAARPSRLGPVLAFASSGALLAAGALALWSISWDD